MIKSVVQWSVERPVVANLLMVFLLTVGGYSAWTMNREIFPEFSLDRVEVSVVYKGASVEEIEESICAKIEDEITGIQGIKEITSVAVEGYGSVIAELESEAKVDRLLNDIKNAVDQIDTFPVDAERPMTVELTAKFPVAKVAVYGNVPEAVLTALAENVKDDLLSMDGISQVELFGNREYEIAIEIPRSNLRKYGLTLPQIADLIKKSTVDLPGGTLKAESGQLLIRTKGRRYRAKEFEDLVVVSRLDGTVVRLNQIAKISDSFEDVDLQARIDGKPSVVVAVDKTSKQDAVQIASRVRKYVEARKLNLPDSVDMAVWNDTSVYIKSRLDLMINNGVQGLLLVLIILALFLNVRVAFWVAMGIPISIVGAFVFLGYYEYTLNMVSMYAFIVVLGIVVDDAIVIGENVYTKMSEGYDSISAAIKGAVEIAYPVINSVATTLVAFAPMMFVSGTMGKFMKIFPVAIMAVLTVSLLEAFLILPAHLAHMKRGLAKGPWWNPFALLERVRERVQRMLDSFVQDRFIPLLRLGMKRRYVLVSMAVALLILAAGLVAGGRIAFVFFPKVDSEVIAAKLIMPMGTGFKTTQEAVRRLENAAEAMAARYPRKDGRSVIQHMIAVIGQHLAIGQSREKGSHIADVQIELMEAESRGIPSSELTSVWRELTGQIPGALSLTFSSTGRGGGPAGNPIEIALLGDDLSQLLAASAKVKKKLSKFAGVQDIEDDYRPGKPELQLTLQEGARQLGITLTDVARQIRANFWGEEAMKIQRGRNEVTIRVRYPEEERANRGDLEMVKIRTADNKELDFDQVASVREYQGPSSIQRKQGRRMVTVSADVDEDRANARTIMDKLSEDFFQKLRTEFPGVEVSLEGQHKDTRESIGSLLKGIGVALFLIYILLVNMFRTYTAPLIIMTAIPFAFIGIIGGHLLFRMDFTILSMFGVLALTGVVVNDSILLLEASNRSLEEGLELEDALVEAARNRFRQIILTTLSTAAGLTPILLETSFQAQFLKPMTVTVVFGLLASTVLILLLIPALTVIRNDIMGRAGGGGTAGTSPGEAGR